MNIKQIIMNSLKFIVSVTKHCALVLLVFACLNTYVYAENNDEGVLIIVPNQTNPYQEIVESIIREFISKRRQEKIQILSLDTLNNTSKHLLKHRKLVIPIGTKAADYYINSNIDSPFVASFTTEGAFTALSAKTASKTNLRKYFVGGVSLEQPSNRLTLLAKLIRPDLKSIGVVLGPNSKDKNNYLQKKTAQVGSNLQVANIMLNSNPVKKLRNIFRKSQVLIVFPDKANFNRSLARWVIALSYKHQVPVISYSKKYTDAGALISLYSNPQQIGKQTAEIALSYLDNNSKQPRKLAVPKYFDLAINKSVKHALNLSFPAKDVLLKKLYQSAP